MPRSEIGDFLRTVLRSFPESSPDTEVDVVVLSCFGNR